MNTKSIGHQTSIDPSKIGSIALKTFFNIAEAWQVKTKDQITLLGKPADSTFYKWKRGEAASIPNDTLERISYIIGIYKGLGMLFPAREQADAWVAKSNTAFNGQTALDIMLQGHVVNLSDVRRHVDAYRG